MKQQIDPVTVYDYTSKIKLITRLMDVYLNEHLPESEKDYNSLVDDVNHANQIIQKYTDELLALAEA